MAKEAKRWLTLAAKIRQNRKLYNALNITKTST